jgi:hypothetical protein
LPGATVLGLATADEYEPEEQAEDGRVKLRSHCRVIHYFLQETKGEVFK